MHLRVIGFWLSMQDADINSSRIYVGEISPATWTKALASVHFSLKVNAKCSMYWKKN